MNRHYYVSNDLDDLEAVENELESSGIDMEQIHVLSNQDDELEAHHLHPVSDLMKQDLVHSGEVGAVVGFLVAALMLVVAYMLGWTETNAGWTPFVFLAVLLLAFGIWEGGFIGIQTQNKHFRRFRQYLKEGKHVFFVDVNDHQAKTLQQVLQSHPGLQMAGTGASTPSWILSCQKMWHGFKRAV